MSSSARINSSLSDVSSLLLEQGNFLKELKNPQANIEFKTIVKKIIAKTKEVNDLNGTVTLLHNEIKDYCEYVDNFSKHAGQANLAQEIYSELIVLGKEISLNFINNIGLNEIASADKNANMQLLKQHVQELLQGLDKIATDPVLVLANYLKIKQSLDFLLKDAADYSGWNTETKKNYILRWSLFFTIVGMVGIFIATLALLCMLHLAGPLAFSGPLLFSCFSVSQSVFPVAAACYSTAVALGPLIGFATDKLMSKYWHLTQIERAVKALAVKTELLLADLHAVYKGIDKSSADCYLPRTQLKMSADKKIEVLPEIVSFLEKDQTDSKGSADINVSISRKMIAQGGRPELTLFMPKKVGIVNTITLYSEYISEFAANWQGFAPAINVCNKAIEIGGLAVGSLIEQVDEQEAAIRGLLKETESLLIAFNYADVIIVLANSMAIRQSLDKLIKQADKESGWSKEKRKAAIYLGGILMAILGAISAFLIIAGVYFFLPLAGAHSFFLFLVSCSKFMNAAALGCYSLAVAIGSGVGYYYCEKLVDKFLPQTPLQNATKDLKKAINDFLAELDKHKEKNLKEIGGTPGEEKEEKPSGTPSNLGHFSGKKSESLPYTKNTKSNEAENFSFSALSNRSNTS
jgi:hypothetical protein